MTACIVRYTAVAAVLILSTTAHAAVAPYFDRSDFTANLSGLQADLDFDDQSAGVIAGSSLPTTIAATGLPGVSVGFPATVPDPFGTETIVPAIIASSADNPTTSAPNTLGTDDADNFNTFVAGSTIDLSFSETIYGLGLQLITPDAMETGDVRLILGGLGEVALDASKGMLLGNFGGADFFSYFIGGLDEAGTGFTTAQLAYGASTPDGAFLFNLDDFTLDTAAAPLPSSLLLLAAGLVSVFAHRRSARRAR